MSEFMIRIAYCSYVRAHTEKNPSQEPMTFEEFFSLFQEGEEEFEDEADKENFESIVKRHDMR
jgi:uncharacterized short protein YbdD (DUF466 family)